MLSHAIKESKQHFKHVANQTVSALYIDIDKHIQDTHVGNLVALHLAVSNDRYLLPMPRELLQAYRSVRDVRPESE